MTEKEYIHQSRRIYIPESTETGIARFDFKDLCDKPMGAGDYIVICKYYHTIFIKNIPKMSLSQKVQAKRFIILVDTLYENKVKTIFLADSKPEELFSHNPLLLQEDTSSREILDALGSKHGHTMFSGQEEIFQFARAVSRLKEMQSDAYLSANRAHVTQE